MKGILNKLLNKRINSRLRDLLRIREKFLMIRYVWPIEVKNEGGESVKD